MAGRRVVRGLRDGPWRRDYEELRAKVLGGASPADETTRRLERFGLAGLASRRPAWQVVVSQAPSPRWSGADPRLAQLKSAYRLVIGGMT